MVTSAGDVAVAAAKVADAAVWVASESRTA
jgi:hypothetical protein